jgi:hypothetical protein
MNLGILIILITILGYFSNWLNGKFLNSTLTHWLYHIGTIIHETSHAILCIVTGAKITEFKIFSKQPHVSHAKSKIPIIGQSLISLAPIAGGLIFIYAINHYLLENYFSTFSLNNINEIPNTLLLLLSQINLLDWQSWVMILLFINIGSMIGPSTRDLKNIWPILIVMFFITWPLLTTLSLTVISLIAINIILQIVIILITMFFKLILRR